MPQSDVDSMNGLMGKLYSVLTSPNSAVQGAVQRSFTNSTQPPFISFCSPGIAVNNLDFGDFSTKDQLNDCFLFSDLADSIPAVSGTWQKSSRRVADIFELAITDVVLPSSDLTQVENETLKRAENFLREEVTVTDPFTLEVTKQIRPTAPVKAYESLFAAYSAAVQGYNGVRITASTNPTPANIQNFALNGPLMQQQILSAYSNWGSLGYRDYVQKANGIIGNLTARGPYALYDRMRAVFNQSYVSSFLGQFHPVFANPPGILGPQFDRSWQTYTFGQNEVHQFSSASSTSYGGGVGLSFGLFSFGGGAQYSNSQSRATCDTTNMSLSVDLVQVPIIRPWFNSWIFSSRGWKGGTTLGGNGSVSSGAYPLTGMMPLVPTSVILARNLKIGIDMTSTVNTAAASSFSASASVGWGCFSIRGNYTRTTSTSSHDFTQTTAGIECKGAQIIGFVCEVLPTSPNYDPNLNWPGPGQPPGAGGDPTTEQLLSSAPWL